MAILRLMTSTPPLGSDTRIADHLRPFWHVGLNPRFDLIWRHGSRLVADRRHFLLDVRRGNRTRDFAVEELDDVAWRAHGRPDALRRLLHLARHAGFIHGRNVGKNRDTLCARDRKRPQETGLDLPGRCRQCRECNWCVARDCRLHHRSAAAERDHHDVELERQLEQPGGEMWGVPTPAMAKLLY